MKKGMSHIEVILSFVIFVGFLIFLLAIFNPFKSEGKDRSYLDVLERAIIQNTSIEVEFMSVNIETLQNECFSLDYALDNIIVRDENKNIIPGYSSNNKLFINGIGKKFLYIYSSEAFEEQTFSGECNQLSEGTDYTLGLYRVEKYISNDSLNEIKNKIDDATIYMELKRYYEIPNSMEFSFSVRDTAGIYLISSRTKDAKEIISRDIPIQIIFKDGSIKVAILNIKIW